METASAGRSEQFDLVDLPVGLVPGTLATARILGSDGARLIGVPER